MLPFLLTKSLVFSLCQFVLEFWKTPKFLERKELPKSREDTENITSSLFQPQRKLTLRQCHQWILPKISHIPKEIILLFYRIFQKIGKVTYGSSLPLISKPDKDVIKNECYRSILLKCTDRKTLWKCFLFITDLVVFKRLICHNQVKFIHGAHFKIHHSILLHQQKKGAASNDPLERGGRSVWQNSTLLMLEVGANLTMKGTFFTWKRLPTREEKKRKQHFSASWFNVNCWKLLLWARNKIRMPASISSFFKIYFLSKREKERERENEQG